MSVDVFPLSLAFAAELGTSAAAEASAATSLRPPCSPSKSTLATDAEPAWTTSVRFSNVGRCLPDHSLCPEDGLLNKLRYVWVMRERLVLEILSRV